MTDDTSHLRTIEQRLLWLSHWMIHNANHIRPNSDGVKVGGHQASCASAVSIMTALYFSALRPEDRVAVKPHASPVFHAMQYLMGNLPSEKMEAFRGYGGVQSYPSRTKDRIPVDFSTGSVGLGVAVTAFASLVQDYLVAHGALDSANTGRMVALMGDAELDEGNIYECLIEGYKHDLRNCWWIVDYNRQSLDATDLVAAHVGAMDICARGLKAAAAMLEDGGLESALAERYAGWQTDGAQAMLESDFDSIFARVHAGEVAPQPRSGRQEILENYVNRFV